ncbi:succinyl-CoA synthetase, alpha subunit [Campylobacter blaseri]|uniref:Succinate--CoA ligase [ADP-forming] subunit alpha n=1 Tax=Campylobacter blaseri TaxID=2042961 RepID=A0A2P8R2L5_9BACT|nr:succinate--CoA ligase subunit alpha [Campylobacter blaseri]PSM52730.1 succinate--CoA ligase subunit alpha [Campylobacter blaseri]PSM54378.1 succinate--CoA ligase subunit alpha [Campylobacter blaseri]QKF86034.1 succinyl-CoA synthetase, alpha subunit [Campylobacter blaseri]
MSILINKNTKVIVQGFTGKEGTFHSKECIAYGTNIVAGVTPFKGGQTHLDRPVFNTVKEAVTHTGASVSLIFIPSMFAADGIMEAANAGIKLAVVITENIPINDMIKAKNYANKCGMKIIGPNCPGVISSNECKLGIMPASIFKKANINIGLISKSGTLTYEGANQIINEGYGVSTAIGIGGDNIIGMTYSDLLPMFEKDDDTKAIVMIGEIGGLLEIEACSVIKEQILKPIVAFIAGKSAPKGKKMGHAGAIISEENSSAVGKIKALKNVGVHVVESPAHIGKKLKEILK